MHQHRIRLKAPWLVNAVDRPGTPPPGSPASSRELQNQIEQLISTAAGPLAIEAIRRFHRPSGLDEHSRLYVEVTTPLQPSQILAGPIEPGETASRQLQPLPETAHENHSVRYRLPLDQQLRHELRLVWNHLAPGQGFAPLEVDLLIDSATD